MLAVLRPGQGLTPEAVEAFKAGASVRSLARKFRKPESKIEAEIRRRLL